MITELSSRQLAYSIASAIRITGLGRTSLYREISAGRLIAHKVGRRTLIHAEDLDRWLASQPIVSSRPGTVVRS